MLLTVPPGIELTFTLTFAEAKALAEHMLTLSSGLPPVPPSRTAH